MDSASRRATSILAHLVDSVPTLSGQPVSGSQAKTFTNPHQLQFYIDGAWVEPAHISRPHPVINPATEAVVGHISLGSPADVDIAVNAATTAFQTFSHSSPEERVTLLERILKIYQRRIGEIADAITLEMGCPTTFANTMQAPIGLMHITTAIEELKKFQFYEDDGIHRVVKEPVGVVGMITPWNWPINQISCKVIPALACGCTMVLKPSELSPFSAIIWAEILHEAGVPKGVFNLINGTGPEVGEAISRHPGIQAVTFTGSTRAGIQVAKAAAETVKRVSQELGGKSPNIILPDADLHQSITDAVTSVICNNAGQSCNAPTRLLVPAHLHDQVVSIAKKVAESVTVGDPLDSNTKLGPVVNEVQWSKIQKLIQKGIDEGATLVTGGVGRPKGLTKGYYVKPTIFANVHNNMTVAREEIFGPVLSILPYRNEQEAVEIANDTQYGLAGEVSGKNVEQMRHIASKLRSGTVKINSAPVSISLPFGGYKQSGNGREWGKWAFSEYLETKAIIGYHQKV